MQTLTRTLSGTAVAAALTVPLLWAAGPAAASGGHHGVTSAGSCSRHGTFKLVAKHDDGAIEVEYEVDTNHAGQRFTVRLTDNGAVIAKRSVTTSRPSGSFTVRKRTSNRAGVDTIRAHAVSGRNVCGGHVRV
jgi:hypothetical protein